jgi:hypothetical protein
MKELNILAPFTIRVADMVSAVSRTDSKLAGHVYDAVGPALRAPSLEYVLKDHNM